MTEARDHESTDTRAESPTPRQGTGRRATWTVLDQAVSSGTNFSLTVLVAHVSSAADFGAFALIMTVGVTFVSVARGVAGDPLASRFAVPDRALQRAATRGAAAVGVAVGALAGAASVAVALVFDQHAWAFPLLALAAVIPGVLLQDFVRSVYVVVESSPRGAFVNDTAWALLMALGCTVLIVQGDVSPAHFVLVWGLTGTACGVMGCWFLRLSPSVSRIRWWLRETRDLWPFFLSDNALLWVSVVAMSSIVALNAGFGDVAGMRAMTTLFGPIIVLSLAFSMFAIPELAKRADLRGARLQRVSLLIGTGLGCVTALIGAAVWLIPERIGRRLLGETWDYTHPLIPFTTIDAVGAMVIAGCVIGLRSQGRGRAVLGARVITSLGRLVVGSVGAVLNGAMGAVGLLALFAPLNVAIWFRPLRVLARQQDHGPVDVAPPSS